MFSLDTPENSGLLTPCMSEGRRVTQRQVQRLAVTRNMFALITLELWSRDPIRDDLFRQAFGKNPDLFRALAACDATR